VKPGGTEHKMRLKRSTPRGRTDGLEDHLEVGRKWIVSLLIEYSRKRGIYTPGKDAKLASN